MPSVTKFPHVLILGAGLGGLTLAQALRKKGVSFEIFERDADIHARFQGWSIALHLILPDLRASLPDDLPSLAESTNHLQPLECEPEFVMYPHGQEPIRIASTTEHELLRANRTLLRDYLSKELHVNWDKHLDRIDETEDEVTLHFKDGSSATGDVLVGADGVHSSVRTHLLGSGIRAQALPLGLVGGEVILNKEQYERQMNLGRSAYIAVGEGGHNRAFVGLNWVSKDASSAKYYWIYSWSDKSAVDEKSYWTHTATQQTMYDYAIEHTKSFDPRLNEIIRLTEPSGMLHPPIVIRDLVLEELPNRRITLLGDACHPMTPFRGEGGNHALQDSLNLARTLAKSDKNNILPNLKEYQDEMLVRGSDAVRKSRAAADSHAKELADSWSKVWQQKR